MRRVWLLMVVWVALMGVAQQKADYRKMSRFVREAAEEGVRSQEIVEAVKAGIADFVKDAEQSDDITLLVVKRK